MSELERERRRRRIRVLLPNKQCDQIVRLPVQYWPITSLEYCIINKNNMAI